VEVSPVTPLIPFPRVGQDGKLRLRRTRRDQR